MMRAAVWMAAVALMGRGSATRVVPVATHWPAGQTRMEMMLVDAQPDGIVREWYEDGTLRSERRYTRGVENGAHVGWWPNGRLKFSLMYLDGVLDGESHEWHANGRRFREAHHVKGHEVGLQRMWDLDGTQRASYEIRDGRRYGSIGAMGCSPGGADAR